jgi:hypothetical protein
MRLRKLALLLTFLAAAFPALAEDDGINWIGDYKEALRLAKETNKPIFLEFRCEA